MRLPILSLLAVLAGCTLFPQRDEEATASLLLQLDEQFSILEAQGLLDPTTVSFVFIHRYGTSYGSSVSLVGDDEQGFALNAADMVRKCLDQTGSAVPRHIKSCLRSNFSSGDELRYSHAGLAYKLPGQQWLIRQSLRGRDTGVHFQWFGTLEEFVNIPLVEKRIEVVVPTIDLQNRLTQSLLVDNVGSDLIDPVYNLVAKPFQTEEQMSNQFVMEVVAASLQDDELPITRTNAQAYLMEHGFRPDILLLGGIRSLAKFDGLIPTMNLDEQPYARRYEIGEIITVLSIQNFLSKLELIASRFEVSA